MSSPPALTEKMLLELAEHEGLVLEAYRDSVGVWTWGFGVTEASGHKVDRYRGKPSTVLRAIEVFAWLVRTQYLPAVAREFDGHALTEAQWAAALSFHWNTGAIGRATWVRQFRIGHKAEAWRSFMNWAQPREIISRRKAERDLFFDGRWSSDGLVVLYERVRPNGVPDWTRTRLIDIRDEVRAVIARGKEEG